MSAADVLSERDNLERYAEGWWLGCFCKRDWRHVAAYCHGASMVATDGSVTSDASLLREIAYQLEKGAPE